MNTTTKPAEYGARRRTIFSKLASNSALFLYGSAWCPTGQYPSEEELERPQQSDFFYLTGCENKASALLLLKLGNKCHEILFSPDRSPTTKLWVGDLPSPPAMAKQLGIQRGLPPAKLDEILGEAILAQMETIYYPQGREAKVDELMAGYLQRLHRQPQPQPKPKAKLKAKPKAKLTPKPKRALKHKPLKVRNSDELLAPMRIVKTPAELAAIRAAADISVAGHAKVARSLAKLDYEYQVAAELSYVYHAHNATHSFPPIVASGANACILHYTDNTARLGKNDLVLIDSGARYRHWNADISRCHPKSPDLTATSPQAQIYLAVLKVQQQICATAHEFASLPELHQQTLSLLSEELLRLGILKSDSKPNAYKKYFPHRTSHWIGLDVHDIGDIKATTLGAGMVFSVEPGLYFAKDDQSVASKWRGIGVRIEDTVALLPADRAARTGKTVAQNLPAGRAARTGKTVAQNLTADRAARTGKTVAQNLPAGRAARTGKTVAQNLTAAAPHWKPRDI